MTQEQKYKLLKYLCMALPYEVYIETTLDKERVSDKTLELRDIEQFINGEGNIKPYLRPMSSMTGEEMEELEAVSAADICNPLGIEYYGLHTESFAVKYEYFGDITGWLLAHHFDFMGLIDEGPALEAPEGMYNF